MTNPNCTCAVADSFNVRASDLVNPNCPIHGTRKVESQVTRTQLTQYDAKMIIDTAQMLLHKGEYEAARVLTDVITRAIGPEGVEMLKRIAGQ